VNRVTRLPVLFRSRTFWALFLLLFALYWFLNLRFQSAALYSPHQQWIRFHAKWLMRVSLEGMRAVDFEIPPLNLLLHILLVSDAHRIFLSALAGFLVAFLILYGLANVRTKTVKLLWSLYLALSPALWFSCLFLPDYVLYLILYCLAFYFLLEFSVSEQVFYLFVFGLLFGLMGLIRFETLWMSIVVFVYFLLRYGKRGLFLYYALAALFPLVSLQLSWVFLSLIFKGEAATLLRHLYVDPFFAFAAFSNPIEQFMLHMTWPFFFLYAVTIVRLGTYREFFRSALFFSLLIPFLSPFFLKMTVQELCPVTFASLFIIHYLILFPYIGSLFNEKRQKLFYSAFLVGYFLFTLFAFSVTPEEHEALFFKRLGDANYPIPATAESTIGATLSGKPLIADEKSTYLVLQHRSDLGGIIHPNHPLYSSALFTPSAFAKAIVMRKGEDRVYREYLKAVERGKEFAGFAKVWEDDAYLILERIPDS